MMTANDTNIIKTHELADEAGVSQMTLSRWAREGLTAAAKLERGKWDREKALSWIADRRADSINEDGKGGSSALLEARVRLYTLQGDGVAARNDLLRANVVYRESAIAAFAEGAAAAIACLDRWVRAGTTAAQIAERQAAANELRTQIAESIRRVAGTLSIGEDVGSSRVRIPRRMGG